LNVSARTDAWARRIGLALGLLLALAAVLSWRIAAEGAALGADARFVAVPPGELTLEPAGEFLVARGLAPSEASDGRLRVRNITGAPVAVRLRARPSSRDLDRPLAVLVRAGGVTLYRGRLRGLRSWSRALTIPRGDARTLDVRARLATRAVGAAVEVTVELRAEARDG
jgi:hypothetical protein